MTATRYVRPISKDLAAIVLREALACTTTTKRADFCTRLANGPAREWQRTTVENALRELLATDQRFEVLGPMSSQFRVRPADPEPRQMRSLAEDMADRVADRVLAQLLPNLPTDARLDALQAQYDDLQQRHEELGAKYNALNTTPALLAARLNELLEDA